MPVPIPFIQGSTEAWTANYTAERSINWYPELDKDGKYVLALRGTPGLTSFATAGSGPGRGFCVMGGILYAVSGNTFYRVNSDQTVTSLGIVAIANTFASLATNGTQIMIVGGGVGYVYTIADGLVEITDPDFHGAGTVVFQDGYFLFNRPGTGRFSITAGYDGTNIDALDFATAEGAPDNLVAVYSNHREPLLFGTRTTEVYYNSGNADFPFDRNPSAFIEMGLAARASVADMDNTVYFLGSRTDTAIGGGGPAVYRLNGYTPQRVSFLGLEERMRTFSAVSDAVAYCYTEEGHSFYVLTFPAAGETWVFDAATELWHERHSWGLTRHRGNFHAYIYGKHLVSDYEDGTIWEQSLDVYAEASNPLVAERRARTLHADGAYIHIPKLQLFFEQGVGLVSGQGSDPQAALSWSNDNGKTWEGNRFASIGELGEYGHRTIWRRLGKARDRLFRVRVSDPVKRNLIGASV